MRCYFAPCDAMATTAGLPERLLQAWLVPRCTTNSPAFSVHFLRVEHQHDLAFQHDAEIQRARLLHIRMRRLRRIGRRAGRAHRLEIGGDFGRAHLAFPRGVRRKGDDVQHRTLGRRLETCAADAASRKRVSPARCRPPTCAAAQSPGARDRCARRAKGRRPPGWTCPLLDRWRRCAAAASRPAAVSDAPARASAVVALRGARGPVDEFRVEHVEGHQAAHLRAVPQVPRADVDDDVAGLRA